MDMISKRIGAFVLSLALVLAGFALPVGGPTAHAASMYYVATDGSNGNAGTLESPFATIQHCADVAAAGDTCLIREGVYREAVTVTSSGTASAPITFKAYQDESVTVSGADLVAGGWSVHSGSIYKTTAMNWDLGLGSNQIFVDGVMVNEARWPNTPAYAEPLEAAFASFDSVSGSTIYDSSLSSGHTGAKINATIINDYASQTAEVTASSNGQLTFNGYSYGTPEPGQRYFLWGKLQYLDAGNEAFYSNGTLYLQTPDGDSPAGHVVEAKRRTHAFDLSGTSSNVHIEGIKIFAADIKTGSNTSDHVIDGVEALYPSYGLNISQGWEHMQLTSGIQLFGTGHTLKNSTVAYSAVNGVILQGTGHLVENNVIHDLNFTAVDGAAIHFGPTATRDHVIQGNTLYDGGRNIVNHRFARNAKILYNDMFHAGRVTSDNGVTYTYIEDGEGTEIAYNVVHDNLASHLGYGIYLDNNTSNYIVHHNVSWGSSSALHMNPDNVNAKVYNNTLVGINHAVGSQSSDVNRYPGSELINNIFTDYVVLPKTSNASNQYKYENNIEEGTIPGFIDASANDYRLHPSSAAIDYGQTIAPYTDNVEDGTPDAGAYEAGAAPWIAGADNAAAGKPASASDDGCGPQHGAKRAVDGLTASKWCSNAPGDDWLQLDLNGQSYSINRWVVKHAGAGGESASLNTADFKLQRSADGMNWTDVDSVTGNTADITNRSVTPFSSRYVRLYITDPGGDATARIYELELYHNGGSSGASDNEAPSAPSNLASPSHDETTIDLTWGASTDNVGVASYDIYVDGSLKGNTAATSYTVTRLAPGVAYSISVKARDAMGNQSAASSSIQVTTDSQSLPAGWQQQDIGAVGWEGGASYAGGVYTVAGSGTDIWGSGSPDELHYVYQPVNGDGEIIARVISMNSPHPNAKSGVMIRETLDGGSKYVIANATPSSSMQSLFRATTQGATDYAIGSQSTAPFWVKLTRSGDSFEAYESADGSNWTLIDAMTVSMNANVYAGLAVVSLDNGELSLSEFDAVSLSFSGAPDTQAPSVPSNLTSPSKTETTVNLTWSASTDNIGVTDYDVFVDGVYHSSTTATSRTVTGLTAGTAYTFTVKAKDAAGNVSAASGAITVTTDSSTPTTYEGEDAVLAGGAMVSTYVGTYSGTGYVDGYWSVGASTTWTVDASSGTQNITIRYANASSARTVSLYVNGSKIRQISLGTVVANDWSAWGDKVESVTLNEGTNTIALKYDSGDSGNVNFDYIIVGGGGGSTDTQAPSTPTNLASPSKTETTVDLTWSASTDNIGVTGYDVFVDGVYHSSTTATSRTVTGLTAGTAYTFTVKAKDAAGNTSAASNAITVTTDSSMPTIYEGEEAVISGGAMISTYAGNYSGSGYVDGYWNVGASTTWTVDAAAGAQDITIRYANGAGATRTVSLYVNGTKVRQISLGTVVQNDWSAWGDQVESVTLNSGSNTISLKFDSADSGNVNFDYILIP